MFGFPGPIGDGALSADGITIPKGDPGDILDAAAKLRQAARMLDGSRTTVMGAGSAAITADGWTGYAAFAFDAVSGLLGTRMDAGARVLERASGIVRTFAHDLRDHQQIAREARREGREAEGRASAAVKSLQRAASDAITARNQEKAAAADAVAARGTADPAGTAEAERRERTAQAAAGRAEAAERKARTALTEANRDVETAIKKAEKASKLADAAAQRARVALMDATAAAKTARVNLGPIPVPVTPTPTNTNPFSAGPFKLPFHGLRPGDVRRQDIEAEAEAARKAAENKPLNRLQKVGQALFSTGFAPIDALTFGQAGKLVNGMPNGKGAWDPDAGGAKVTKWFGPGVVAKKGLSKGADKIVGNAQKKGPLPRIFPTHPRDKPGPMGPHNVPNKVRITRGPDGKPKVERAPEPRARGGAESRKAEDGRRNGPKETSGGRREAGATTARVGINTKKAIDDMVDAISFFF